MLRGRVRHKRRRFRPPKARGSLGFLPLQGAHSRWNSPAFTAPPLARLADSGRERPKQPLLRVSLPPGLAGLSQGCRPSWGLAPSDSHERSGRMRLGSCLLRDRGASPPPVIPSLNRLTFPAPKDRSSLPFGVTSSRLAIRCVLFGGLRKLPGGTRTVTRPSPPLMGLLYPAEFLSQLTSTRIG